jgi:putative membrane protein
MEALPLYLAYIVVSLVLLATFTIAYIQITPIHEFALIKAGNRAAALSLSGVMIGFGVVLAVTAANSVSLVDLAIWGAVALVCQILLHFAVGFFIKDFRQGIESGKDSYGIFMAALALAVAAVNAGAVTY